MPGTPGFVTTAVIFWSRSWNVCFRGPVALLVASSARSSMNLRRKLDQKSKDLLEL